MDALVRLERLIPGPAHYRILLLLGLGWAFDAMDVGLIAFTLPAIKRDLALTPAAAGLLASAGLLGMLLGAGIGGRLADLWGRSRVVRASLLSFGLGSLLSALSPGYGWLLLFRFFTGLGLGAELPVASSLLAELVPSRHRGRFLVWLEAFWAVGWLVAALAGFLLVPAYGWRIAFAAGALPAFYVLYLRQALPESPRWLWNRGRHEAARAVVESLAAGTTETEEAPEPAQATGPRSYLELLRPPLLRRTAFIALAWFLLNAGYYGAFIWLPSLLHQQGYTLVRSLGYVLLMTLAQLPGYLSAAWLIDRIGRRAVLVAYLLLSGLFAWMLGHAQGAGSILLYGSLLSFFNLGAWGSIYAYTPELFPTSLRASGAGLAAAVGRVGGILAPYLTGALLATLGFSGVLALHGLWLILAGVAAALVGLETRGRVLEE